MNKLEIDVSENILKQFGEQFNSQAVSNVINLNPEIGKGRIKEIYFPGGVEFCHFTFNLSNPIELNSFNPEDSDWLLLNINLSENTVSKIVNNQQLDIQKYLPSGILLYTPNTKVYSKSPPNQDFEIVLIRISKHFFSEYKNQDFNIVENQDAIVYEDLSFVMEKALKSIIKLDDNTMRAHSFLIQFISDLVEKLKRRTEEHNYEHLHPNDIKGLFMSSAYLRNPIAKNTPSIEGLSKIAGMGTTKYKTTFKQVFGLPPKQYHQKIKFEYAKEQLESKKKTASEISYELGYSHPSKFTNAYKKQFGELPSAVY